MTSDGVIAAYAITGRAGRNGYLQRVAVDPSARRVEATDERSSTMRCDGSIVTASAVPW